MIMFVPFMNDSRYDSFSTSGGKSSISLSLVINDSGSTGQKSEDEVFCSSSSAAASGIPSYSKLSFVKGEAMVPASIAFSSAVVVSKSGTMIISYSFSFLIG